MPVAAAHYDAGTDALAASFPSGCVVRLYAGVADPSVGPSPGEELSSVGGYAPAAFPGFDAAVDGVAHADVDFGTSSAAWSDVASVWGLTDSSDVLRWWDFLQQPVEVTAAGVTVPVGIDLYPGSPQ